VLVLEASMKALVILNAGAGRGKHADAGRVIADAFNRAGIDHEILTAGKKKKALTKLRKRLNDGFDLVVAGGGDGTVSGAFDVLHGTDIPLAIIPLGTGNIIAREFNIPVDVEGAINVITGPSQKKKIDAMKIGDSVYILNAGVGISAAVVERTSDKSKSRFGLLAYISNVMKMLGAQPRRIEISVDGNTHRYRAVEVAVNNCGVLARTIYPRGPDIRADDGHVDVWILGMQSFFDYFIYFVAVLFGRRRKARFLTAKERVVINSATPMIVQADGDLIGTTPVEINVLPSALTILVPGETA
jgi:YegS/Rv2252/BmrU family lipid kinase